MNLSVIEIAQDTPSYVLMDKQSRIGPKVELLEAGVECSSIYGFSDKARYDEFCSHSQLELVPYPLVKGYLQNQVDSAGTCLKLVAMNASGPDTTILHAVTMEAVLNAYIQKLSQVTTRYRLIFDPSVDVYKVEEA